MDYLRSFLSSQNVEDKTSGADTIERLCHRVQTSSLLDDRRDAVRALKSLSKKFRLDIGTQAMDILINVLQNDRSDTEIVGYAIDTLHHVMSNEPLEEDDALLEYNVDFGEQFTEIFIKKHENVALLVSLLEEYEFHVRWPTVRLLTVLLRNCPKDLQECLLVVPMAVSKLMDLLFDNREIIRNDTLLLLNQLTVGHGNIQKIVAFENAFERILDIIVEEGSSDGGIVVEDCLHLLLNLLRNNVSNQNFFKEGSYIHRLSVFFDLDDSPANRMVGWSAQKVANTHLMLQLVRTLVSPGNPQNQTVACQKLMNQCNLLQKLCSILMASGIPADVLTETINTVSEVIRGYLPNQEFFASVFAPSTPPRPAIVVLLMSMVNEKQPFVLRCAVLYCFQSFLYKNDVGQYQITQTLLPTSVDVNTTSAGQLLCQGLFSADSLSNWFAAVALLHAMLGNVNHREQMLRVQLASSVGMPPVSLLQQCCSILTQGAKLQTRIGLLMLLSSWLADCPLAVTQFLSNNAIVPFLISQVSSSEGDELELIVQGICAFVLGLCMISNDDQCQPFTKASLKEIILNRIGLEVFTDKLTQVAQNENYTRAAKKPQPSYQHPNEVVFSYEFTRLFKDLESEVLVAVSGLESVSLKVASRREHESIVESYKDLIKEQDQRLNEVSQSLLELQSEHADSSRMVVGLQSQVLQLKDQNTLLKAQKDFPGGPMLGSANEDVFGVLCRDVHALQVYFSQNTSFLEPTHATNSGSSVCANGPCDGNSMSTLIERIAGVVQELQKDTVIRDHREHSEPSQSQESDASLHRVMSQLHEVSQEKIQMDERLKKSNVENLNLSHKLRVLQGEKESQDSATKVIQQELEDIKKEQEDLLVLLADQEAKISKFTSRLKELGQEVNDEDDYENDDDDYVAEYEESDKAVEQIET